MVYLCNGAEFAVPLTAEIEQRQIQGMQFLRQLRLMPEEVSDSISAIAKAL